MTQKCNGCNATAFINICTRADGLGIVRCRQCGLEFVNPTPDDTLLEEIYNKNMRSDEAAAPLFQRYIKERKSRLGSYERVALKRLALIEKNSKGEGDLLDIGCGAGFFLKFAQEKGWNVHGIEILPEYVEFAKKELGLENMHGQPLETLKFPDNSFDVITLWDLIEHLQYPAATIKEVYRVLRPGGIIVVWTPNSRNASYLKNNWFGYTITTHLYFFSPDSLNSMLSQAGFETIYAETNKTRKGLLSNTPPKPYKAPLGQPSKLQKRLRGLKRDVKNALNPMTYLSPVLDRLGYGFNIFTIAQKK